MMLGWLIMALFLVMFIGLGLTVTGYAHLARRGIPAMLIGLLVFATTYYVSIGEAVLAGVYFIVVLVLSFVYVAYEPAPVPRQGGGREW